MLILAVPAFACDGDLFEPLIPLLRPDFEVETVVAEAPDMAACAAAVVAASRDAPSSRSEPRSAGTSRAKPRCGCPISCAASW